MPSAQAVESQYKKMKMYRDEAGKRKQTVMIIRVCAIMLVVFFFVLPLVRCTYYPDLTVSGWNMASGTGEIFDEFGIHGEGEPVLFVFLIIPLALAIVTFMSIRPLGKFYLIQTILAVAGVLAKLFFVLEMNARIRRGIGFESTGFHWLVLLMYIGMAVLAGIAYYLNMQVSSGYGGGRVYSPEDGFRRGENHGGMPYPPEDVFCTRCGKQLEKNDKFCGYCGNLQES